MTVGSSDGRGVESRATVKPARLANAVRFVGTIAALVVTIGGLLTLDVILVRMDHRETVKRAAADYRRGMGLLTANRPAAAVEWFAAALAADRTNASYALALGEAQTRQGDFAAAEATLRALLGRMPNDGAVNLAMARVVANGARTAEAKAYFHRAIYGHWAADSVARRRTARLELIELLARTNSPRELLAELLPFEDVSPDSIALRRRLGRWFLLAESPRRAAAMFREVLRRDPRDAEAYAGMGEAALAQGNFRTAHADFLEASTLRPRDATLAARLTFADSLLHLDPTARGIEDEERYERARQLVERTLVVIEPCVEQGPAALTDSARALLADSTASVEDADADHLTTVANNLWTTYASTCQAYEGDSVLHFLHARLSQ